MESLASLRSLPHILKDLRVSFCKSQVNSSLKGFNQVTASNHRGEFHIHAF